MTIRKLAVFVVLSLAWAAILTVALRLVHGHDWWVSMLSAGIVSAILLGILIYGDRNWMSFDR